ncbi:hypothetical protein Syun_025379 [Stephania yunnanensis]|uniref:Bulb-type lectin domain-containing protein n=1 Tax=Stephania yunnanensis TaxID=152371 RepID=A0AAP0F0G1_9MAGN
MASVVACLFLLCTLFIDRLGSVTDTIKRDKFLRDGETLVSNGGNYALGFFNPENSKQRYVGIWYEKVPEQTGVWVANRDDPINGYSSGVAKVDGRGNLCIFDGEASNPVWSTNVSVAISDRISSLFYKILDTGNLVLCDGENTGDFLWQSFDYPTDAYLPGMKIGLNLCRILKDEIIKYILEAEAKDNLYLFTGHRQNHQEGKMPNNHSLSTLAEIREKNEKVCALKTLVWRFTQSFYLSLI